MWPFDSQTSRELLRIERESLAVLKDIRRELRHLAYIDIRFTHSHHHHHHPGGSIMPVGPATLAVGQSSAATVVGFDQVGAPFAIDFNDPNFAVSWAVDDPAVLNLAPQPDQSATVTGASAGVANVTATCAGFTKTQQVTVTAPSPILSSIDINFA